MERITAPQVRGMFDRAVQAARSLGLTAYRWELQEGSPTNGRAWRLYQVLPGGGHRDLLGSDGYLGWTTREAYGALHALARAWELAYQALPHIGQQS
jgi:hypothetical protein